MPEGRRSHWEEPEPSLAGVALLTQNLLAQRVGSAGFEAVAALAASSSAGQELRRLQSSLSLHYERESPGSSYILLESLPRDFGAIKPHNPTGRQLFWEPTFFLSKTFRSLRDFLAVLRLSLAGSRRMP